MVHEEDARWWGCLDGGAPSAQAALVDADAVTGAQRDPTQLANAYLDAEQSEEPWGALSLSLLVVASS